YHAHDFPGLLQLALTGFLGRSYVYDSHELFFDRPLPDLPKPIEFLIKCMRPLEKPLARRASGVITVNDSIADRLSETLGVKRPIVIRNAVDIRTLAPSEARFPIHGRRVIVHSGRLASGRHLVEIVSSLAYLPDDVALV